MEETILMDRRLLSILILAVLVLLSIHLVSPVSAEATYTATGTMIPFYDSYVSSAEPNSNYYSHSSDYRENYLVVANSINTSVGTKITYMMFDLSGLTPGNTINSAVLQMRTNAVTEPHRIGVHYCSDNSWKGYSITWDNKPPFSAEAVETVTVTKEEAWYNWTVTDCVRTALQGKWLSLVVKCEDPAPHGYQWVKFYSKKYSYSEYRPLLVISQTRIISWTGYEPLAPTQDDDVTVTCHLTNASEVREVNLYYRVDGGEWSSRPMAHTGGLDYTATIPRQSGGARVSFYVEVIDIFQNRATWTTLSYEVEALWWSIPWSRILAVLAVLGFFFGYRFIKKRRPRRVQPKSPHRYS